MPKFRNGDIAQYVGSMIDHDQVGSFVCEIISVKTISSETDRPIYKVRFEHNTEEYQCGIHERNLKLVKSCPHNWEL